MNRREVAAAAAAGLALFALAVTGIRGLLRRRRAHRPAPPPPLMVCPECMGEEPPVNVVPIGSCGFCEPPRPAWVTFQELVDRLHEDGLDGWEFTIDIPPRPTADSLSTEEMIAEAERDWEPALVEALVDEFDAVGYWDDPRERWDD